MYQVIWQEEHKIEIALTDEITADEFRQVIHQLESLCTMNPHINVLFDARDAKKYDFKIVLDEFDFFKKYKQYLQRVALVSDSRFAEFLIKMFDRFTDTEFRHFDTDKTEEARNWIFPSRLP